MFFYGQLKNLLDQGLSAVLVTVLSADQPGLSGKKLILGEESVSPGSPDFKRAAFLKESLKNFLLNGQSGVTEINLPERGALEVFVHIYQQRPRLIIFGGGHVGAFLSKLAASFDFEVIVVDDRQEFCDKKVHPEADQTICTDFAKAFEILKPRPTDYLVIVTRGHQHDFLCLKKALQYKNAYLGMIGSKKRVGAQLALLKEEGYSDHLLEKIYAPIGLEIGAVTAPEIALSILAQVVKVRRARDKSSAGRLVVLEKLAALEKGSEKAVLATVIKASGSTPGKTGAQMIIFSDATTLGTVGGGSAEAKTIKEAADVLARASTKRLNFSLTADTAAEEGMACGGSMQIYLEPLGSRH